MNLLRLQILLKKTIQYELKKYNFCPLNILSWAQYLQLGNYFRETFTWKCQKNYTSKNVHLLYEKNNT